MYKKKEVIHRLQQSNLLARLTVGYDHGLVAKVLYLAFSSEHLLVCSLLEIHSSAYVSTAMDHSHFSTTIHYMNWNFHHHLNQES